MEAGSNSMILARILMFGNLETGSRINVRYRESNRRGPARETVTAYRFDDVDRQLLDPLQEDARYTAIELAEEIGVPDNAIHDRMDRLEEAGVIIGYPRPSITTQSASAATFTSSVRLASATGPTSRRRRWRSRRSSK